MTVAAGSLVTGALHATPVALGLLAAAGGLTSGFSIPAAAVLPRLFFADAELPRAMALIGGGLQVARIVGAPAGGLLFGSGVPLAALLGIDAAGFALLALGSSLVLRARGPLLAAAGAPAEAGAGHDRPIRDPAHPRARASDGAAAADSAVGLLRRTPLLRMLLVGTALLAGGVLPAMYVGAPLLARARGWPASVAGLIEAGWIGGGLCVTVLVIVRGAARRAGVPMVLGPLVVAAGLVGLACAPGGGAAVPASVIVGAGVVVYTVHAFPLYLASTPAGLAARLQSILAGVQSVAMAICGYAVGWVAARFSPATAVLAAAVVAAATAGLGALSRTSRTAVMPA